MADAGFDNKQYWDRRKSNLRGQLDPVVFEDRTSEEYQKHNGTGKHHSGTNRAQYRARFADHKKPKLDTHNIRMGDGMTNRERVVRRREQRKLIGSK